MKRFALLLLIVITIPMVGALIGTFAKYRSESTYYELIKEKWGEIDAKEMVEGKLSLEHVSNLPEFANDSFIENYTNVRMLQKGSLATIAVGLLLSLIILFAGLLASIHRRLLLLLFSPGLKLVLLVLFGIILAQGAITTYSIYILEVTLINRFHPFLIGSIGLAAAAGAFSMIVAGFSISKRVSLTITGVRLLKADEPALWDFVEGIAKKLGATIPKNIVVGLDPNFFVTSADVALYPENANFSEETLYLSLPFIRIFTKDELKAVIGHELGHFRGDDTKYSLKFYPIYAGTNKAIQALTPGNDYEAGSLLILPAYAVLIFFMERFAIAENKISRLRELQADKAGSDASSSMALISSLLKLGALAGMWSSVRKSMVDALNQGNAIVNASSLYAEAAFDCLDIDMLMSSVNASIPHPTDSHPTISQRMENLGLTLAGFRSTYSTPETHDSAFELLSHPIEIEKGITIFEHQVILAMGQAKLPEEEPQLESEMGN